MVVVVRGVLSGLNSKTLGLDRSFDPECRPQPMGPEFRAPKKMHCVSRQEVSIEIVENRILLLLLLPLPLSKLVLMV